MLKKLSKYGNSTTLVIDKAILELLGMEESSMVKLQTDGKSLIITPVASVGKDKVSYSSDEAMNCAKEAFKNEMTQNWEKKSAEKKAEIVEKMPEMSKEFTKVFDKYKDVLHKSSHDLTINKEFQEAVEQLAQKYDPVAQSALYLQEFQKLNASFFPEMAELTKEIEAISQKYSA